VFNLAIPLDWSDLDGIGIEIDVELGSPSKKNLFMFCHHYNHNPKVVRLAFKNGIKNTHLAQRALEEDLPGQHCCHHLHGWSLG
jgi:hypothetical protein